MVTTPISVVTPTIEWISPPDNFVLDDMPVQNNEQPPIADALKESLELTERLPTSGMVGSDISLSVQIDGKHVLITPPAWLYISHVNELHNSPRRVYTPNLEGAVPDIVMEFLSEGYGEEHSMRRNPVGKFYFYREILKVPNYIIFDPNLGHLEVHRFQSGHHTLEPNSEGRYWLAELGLFLGVWQGPKGGHNTHWLRWWDAEGNRLPWAIETE